MELSRMPHPSCTTRSSMPSSVTSEVMRLSTNSLLLSLACMPPMSLSIFLNHSLRERARKGEECLDRGGVGEGLNRHAPGNRPTVRRARPTLVGDAVVGVRERARAARELGRFRHRWRILRMYRYVFASAMCVCARACVCVCARALVCV